MDDVTQPAPAAPAAPAAAPVAPAAPAARTTTVTKAASAVAPAAAPNVADEGNKRFYDSLPATWRDEIVSGLNLDEGKANQLGRFQSFPKFVDAFFHAQDKISKGQAASPLTLPDKATAEQVTEYRTKLGLPLTAKDYKLLLDDGLVLGDDDERIMVDVMEAAHANFVKPEVVSAMTNAMLAAREREIDSLIQSNNIAAQQATTKLKEVWGTDYQSNLNAVQGLINHLPESVRESFEQASTSTGALVFNSPEIMVWMADMARQINPAATVLPNSANPVQGVEDEIKKLEAQMGTPEWFKDADAQKRYMQLLDTRAALAKKNR